jgi:hypothetical protein
MSHHQSHEHEDEKTPAPEGTQPDPEAPDPAGNPGDHTSPRTPQEADPERVERGREEFDRTIAS